MNKTSTSIYDNVKCNFKIWLSSRDDEGIIGDGKWQILKAIEKHGSLTAATKALGITYRRTWSDLKKIEDYLGFALIEKVRGGRNGGQTTLTKKGRSLINAFDKLHYKIDGVIEDAFVEFKKELKNTTNEK